MSSTAPSVNMNMAGMNMTGMNMTGMNMNMSMSGISAACGMTSEPKQCGVQFPLHAQRRKRRVLFTQAQVKNRQIKFPILFFIVQIYARVPSFVCQVQQQQIKRAVNGFKFNVNDSVRFDDAAE